MMSKRIALAAAAWLAMGAGGAETAGMARGSRLIAETQASPLQAVIDWFERAHREYQGVVIKELSIPTGKPAGAPQAPPDVAKASSPALLDRVRGWLGFGPTEVVSKPSGQIIPEADKAELEARIRKQIEAREAEKQKVDEERLMAEAAKAARQALEKADGAQPKPPSAQIAEAPKEGTPPQRPAERADDAGAPAKTAAPPPPEPQIKQAEAREPGPEPMQPVQSPAVPGVAATARPAAPPAEPAPSHVTPPPLPSHWNRIPRDGARVAQAAPDAGQHGSQAPSQLAQPASEAAQKLAASATKAADKLFGVERENAGAHGRTKGCARAGKSVDPPATYTVRKGDSLWAIAHRHYGNGVKYMRIVRANESRIKDPDLIYPCQKVYLPKRHAWLVMQQLGFVRS